MQLTSQPISEHVHLSRKKPRPEVLLSGRAHADHVQGLGLVPSNTTAQEGPYPPPPWSPLLQVTAKLLCLWRSACSRYFWECIHATCVLLGLSYLTDHISKVPLFWISSSLLVTAVCFATLVLSTVDGHFVYHVYWCYEYSWPSFCGDKCFPLS